MARTTLLLPERVVVVVVVVLRATQSASVPDTCGRKGKVCWGQLDSGRKESRPANMR